jgi:dTMP kinase
MKIVFEGIDGSGKSSLIDMLYWVLLKGGIPTVKIKEPFDDKLINDNITKDPYTQALLFTLDRVLKAKEDYSNFDIVLSDRSIVSSFVYQNDNEDVYHKPIKSLLSNSIVKIPRIDIVVVVDVPVEIAVSRRSKSLEDDNKEKMCSSLPERYSEKWMQWEHRRLAYMEFDFQMLNYHANLIIVNGNQPIQDVFNELMFKLIKVLENDEINNEYATKVKRAYEQDKDDSYNELPEPSWH